MGCFQAVTVITGNRFRVKPVAIAKTISGIAFTASLSGLGYLLFFSTETMPLTVLTLGMIAIGTSVHLCEEFIDHSRHIKLHD